jgi:hypothetical protein
MTNPPMKVARFIKLLLLSVTLHACAPTQLVPGAELIHVLDVSPDKIKASCTLLGKEVIATQGNIFEGDYTSIDNMNELKNEAYKLGANAIYIEQRQDINRAGGTINESVTVCAYKCK